MYWEIECKFNWLWYRKLAYFEEGKAPLFTHEIILVPFPFQSSSILRDTQNKKLFYYMWPLSQHFIRIRMIFLCQLLLTRTKVSYLHLFSFIYFPSAVFIFHLSLWQNIFLLVQSFWEKEIGLWDAIIQQSTSTEVEKTGKVCRLVGPNQLCNFFGYLKKTLMLLSKALDVQKLLYSDPTYYKKGCRYCKQK